MILNPEEAEGRFRGGHLDGVFGVAHRHRQSVQLRKADVRLQVLGGLRQRLQLLVRCREPWCTVSTRRRKPGRPCGSGLRRSPIDTALGRVALNTVARPLKRSCARSTSASSVMSWPVYLLGNRLLRYAFSFTIPVARYIRTSRASRSRMSTPPPPFSGSSCIGQV